METFINESNNITIKAHFVIIERNIKVAIKGVYELATSLEFVVIGKKLESCKL